MNNTKLRKETATKPYVEFQRGYQKYVSFGIGIVSSIGIWYRLVGFDVIFPSIFDFTMVFLPVLVIGGFILGRGDYRKGTYQAEAEIAKTTNPNWIDLYAFEEKMERRIKLIMDHLGIEESEE